MPRGAVPGERIRRQDAALFREMLEGVAGKEVAPDVAAPRVLDAGHDHEIGVGADGVERIELDAAQTLEHRPHATRAAAEVAVEAVMRDEQAPRSLSAQSDGGHALASATSLMRAARPWSRRSR
jgi:hypothetical protein